MIKFLTLLALSCATTKVVNHTKVWSKNDERALNGAKVRCGQIYPNSPCVRTFYKMEENRYRVICGHEEKK